MANYELIVIGAGPGGYVAALQAAKFGLKVAVVENRESGGTCLNRGCIPTKTMLHSSHLYHQTLHGADMGIQTGSVEVNMEAIYARKARVSQKLSSGIDAMFNASNVDKLIGTGMVVDSHTVQVSGPEGTELHSAENILVATGSVPARPPIPGLDLPGVMTSDDLLDGDAKQFASIVIIGGGVIGVEFATFYNDLGCDVTIVEGLDRLLPSMDRDLGQSLTQTLKKRGIKIHTRAMVERIEQDSDGLNVHFSVKGAPVCVNGEAVLCAIGRRPNTAGVFAPGLEPEMVGSSLKVDDRFQTSIPNVYAVGDVSSRIQLAHVASAQGTAFVEMLCGKEPSQDLSIVPSCVYCRPEIASVGMTEQDAKEAGIAVKSGKCVMHSNGRTIIEDSDRSFMKVIAAVDDHRILGAQFMCPRSTDMISQISQAIANRMTPQQLLMAMRPHPTFEEALGEALEDLVSKLNR